MTAHTCLLLRVCFYLSLLTLYKFFEPAIGRIEGLTQNIWQRIAQISIGGFMLDYQLTEVVKSNETVPSLN